MDGESEALVPAVDNSVDVTWHQQCQDWFAAHPQLKVGVEVGVWCGSLSRRLLASGVEHLTLVDAWKLVLELTADGARIWGPGYSHLEVETAEQIVRTWAMTEPRARVLKMDSLDAAKLIADHSQDFVIIDARHDYHAVADDIEAWWPKVKPGGYLVGDDYSDHFPGVAQAVQEAFGARAVLDPPMWWVQA